MSEPCSTVSEGTQSRGDPMSEEDFMNEGPQSQDDPMSRDLRVGVTLSVRDPRVRVTL